jgi:hypothetical protein
MANTINIPKTHLIMGLSLPLAVLIGYFLAEPMELGSIAVVFAVLGVLCVPLLMVWYHPLLVLSWNLAINLLMLPGRPALWSVMALIGLFFAVLNRAVDPKARFITVPSLTYSLLLLVAVTVGTALMTGGFGAASLGSSQYGGGKYVGLLSGIAGYFALTSRRIPPHRAGLYVACFFLSGLSYGIATFAIMAGPQFHFLLSIFSATFASDQLSAEGVLNVGMVRLGGLQMMAIAIYSYMLARFGIRGLLDATRPWRLLLFLLALGAGLYGGFRSYVALFGLTFAGLFFLEGLHRTRYLAIFLGAGLLGSAILLPQAHKLPLVAQRALSFLPGKFDAVAVESATTTTGWRLEMWKQVLPEVPQYLFRGKGFALDPTDLYLAGESQRRFQGDALAGTIVAGDYHNGPLSILIPFGIYGMIAFLWFLIAGVRLLHRNYKFGNPAYRNVNALLLAAFAARAFFFFIFFGSLHSDMPFFTGLLGLSVALNGADASALAQAERPAVGVELNTEYIRA